MSEVRQLKIGNVELGGLPGELPTVLIGSIFYEGHRIVEDAKKGVFNKERAKELVAVQEELSQKTGNPHMVDVVGITEEAIEKFVSFIVDITEAPILIDSSLASVKIAGIRCAHELGASNRIVYNSISCYVKEEELKAIVDYDVKSAVLLAYNPNNVLPEGRVEILKGLCGFKGLLKLASESGVENLLVDVAVLDVPSIGIALDAIKLVREEVRLPCGGGPLNAVLEWRKAKELSEHAHRVCGASSVALLQLAGASFVLYGPIERAKEVFPAAAMVDAIVAYEARFKGVKTKSKNHPLYKIF